MHGFIMQNYGSKLEEKDHFRKVGSGVRKNPLVVPLNYSYHIDSHCAEYCRAC
jgi:hypothetical protein